MSNGPLLRHYLPTTVVGSDSVRSGNLGAARLLRQPARPAVLGGHYDFLFPAVLAARVDQLVLEFAGKGLDDLRLIKEYGWPSGSWSIPTVGCVIVHQRPPGANSALWYLAR